jgi:HEAT repeat protein
MVETLLSNLQDIDTDVRRAAAEGLERFPSDETIDALVNALSDPNRGVAEASENSLLSIRGVQAIKKVIPLLSSEQPNLRNFAFEILSEIGGDSLDDITELLKNNDKDIRKFATDILGELAEPLAVQPLIDSLDDEDINVAAAAAEGLGKIRDKRAIPELIKRLESDVWMQCSVIKSLSMFDDPQASEKVYNIFPKLKGISLFSAISALGEVGGESAIPALINLLSEENKAFKSSIIGSLEKIINRNDEASYDASKGKIKVNELLDLLNDPKVETKLNTIHILGWLKNEEAIKPLVDELIEAEKRLDSAKEDITELLLDAIIKIDPKDISYITAVLSADDTSTDTKAELVDILGRLKKVEALTSLISLKDSPSPIVRRVVARTLGEFDHPDSIEALKLLLTDAEGHTRGNSTKSLGRLRVESAIDDLISVFDDEFFDIRELAAFALASIGTDDVINKLKDIVSGSLADKKKRLALLALGKINKPAAMNILFEHFKDSDPAVRKTAIEAISYKCLENCIDKLIPMLEDENDDVKIAAVTGLSKGDLTKIIPHLLKTLKESTHLKVKYHIVETLGNSKASEATDTLLQLLDDQSSVMVLSAIEALGKIQDEKAVEPLQKLCGNDDREIAKTAKEAVNNIVKGF